jgi:DNA-directed RNA polymerase specialized sigma24 family protein
MREGLVTQPVSTPHEVGLDDYDARFTMGRDRLIRICTGLVGTDAAEDVVHDAFVRGRRRFHQLRDEDLFEAWITRIAINVCLDLQRANRRFTEVVRAWWRTEREHPPPDLGLRELIERLPPRERTLVVLHYGYGYRMEDIAGMTGLSAVNVRTVIFRARRRLRDQLEAAER